MQLRQILSEDGDSLRLEVLDAGTLACALDMSAADLDDLIVELSRNRGQMQDTVPIDLEYGSQIATIPAPTWYVHAATTGGRSLFLRHPGFGWLGFVFPSDEAAILADRLKKEFPRE